MQVNESIVINNYFNSYIIGLQAMNKLASTNLKTPSPLEYRGLRVITFAMIDAFHKRPAGTANRNFKSNREKFIDSEDYFLLEKQAVNIWRDTVEIKDNGTRLVLLTMTGYLMVVKSLTEVLDWNAQRQLIQKYFTLPTYKRLNRRSGDSGWFGKFDNRYDEILDRPLTDLETSQIGNSIITPKVLRCYMRILANRIPIESYTHDTHVISSDLIDLEKYLKDKSSVHIYEIHVELFNNVQDVITAFEIAEMLMILGWLQIPAPWLNGVINSWVRR